MVVSALDPMICLIWRVFILVSIVASCIAGCGVVFVWTGLGGVVSCWYCLSLVSAMIGSRVSFVGVWGVVEWWRDSIILGVDLSLGCLIPHILDPVYRVWVRLCLIAMGLPFHRCWL